MDAERIIQDLNRRFAKPLPEFYKRRIVVWYDEDREFEDKLDSIQVDGAKLLALTGSNSFQVKKTLAVDDPYGNYLLYCPLSYEALESDWLLDVKLYSEEFRADLISMWMNELHLQQTPALRSCVKRFRPFFDRQKNRTRLSVISPAPVNPGQLMLSMMAVLLGCNEAKPAPLLKAVLSDGLNAEENPGYQELARYDLVDAFWQLAQKGTGFEREHDLEALSAHILLTASTRTVRQEHLSGLESFISVVHQAWCYDFVSDWIRSEDADSLWNIGTQVETSLKLPQRFMKLQVSDLLDTEVFPCVNEVILVKLMTEIGNHIIDDVVIPKTVEKRRVCAWYENFRNYYEGLLQVARMQTFFKAHAAGFHTVEPAKVWKEYTSEYYLMDTYYREFHRCYSASLKKYDVELSDLFRTVMEKVEGLYVGWFLTELSSCWTNACSDEMREYGRIMEVSQQSDFYRLNVASSNTKSYVIISDALRYDVAASLTERLRRETQAKVDLQSVQAIFPTITKFGMAALLPHKELTVAEKSDGLSVLADGVYTDANYREKILKSADPASVALKYSDLIGMKGSERRTLVKGMNVVYIYHDTIDEAGHNESGVFDACETTIEELKNMVRIIANEWGGTNILITADHGFLYTKMPLKEDAKVDKTTESAQDVEIGRRYAIMKKGASPDYLLPVQFLEGKTEFDAFSPRDCIRIRKLGGGLKFVHGGISLQEMVVPVIEYHFLRNQSVEYKQNRSKYDTKPVEISLLSSNRKISNMIFSLDFYQKEPVGGNREKAAYLLYFTDSNGLQVSDVQKIIADRTSDNGQERTFRCSFNLKSMKFSNTELYALVIEDENGLQVDRAEFHIDIAFAVDDFDFGF